MRLAVCPSLIGCFCLLQYILNDREVEVKTELWIKQNAEYLKEQKEKEERINKEKEQGTYKEKKKKHKKREQIEAATAGEAIEKMLEKKRISSKINYDVLRDLNQTTGSLSTPTPKPTEGAATRKRLSCRRRKKNSNTNAELSANAVMMTKRFRRLISSSPRKKKAPPQMEPAVTMETETEAISEAPPEDVPDTGITPADALPLVETEEEEAEEECVSALQLVGDYGCEEEEVF
ncbi:hypothetical protein XENORESO_018863 [Xenotaenia resolanae]|uniref:Brf1 TBP-binding domain-containing protein n=2 Tax=Goodeidae TaxID=28758 RepID=A0ABV0VRK1_9TELE